MKKFKDFVIDDNKVFFNINEFGEIHNIEGQDCTIVFNTAKLEELKSANFEYISNDTKLFCIEKDELGFEPQIDDCISFDSKIYQIDSVDNMGDILEIMISMYRG